jgi:drug/metabolite transporter (DMT)-like permease
VLVAALVLTVLCALKRERRLRPRELATGAGAGAAFAAAGFGEFEALARAPAPAVVLLVFVAPVWVALGSWAAGRGAPGWPTAAALGLILGGLALLLGLPGGEELDPGAAGLALGASLMSALFFVSLAALMRSVRPLRAACVAAWSAALVAVVLQPDGVAHELSRAPTAAYGIAIGCLTACALGLLASGLRMGSALWASALIGVEPLVAAALSALVLGEFLGGTQLAGAAAVLAGVTAMSVLTGPAPPSPGATGRTRRPRRESRPPPRPARTARPRRSGGRSLHGVLERAGHEDRIGVPALGAPLDRAAHGRQLDGVDRVDEVPAQELRRHARECERGRARPGSADRVMAGRERTRRSARARRRPGARPSSARSRPRGGSGGRRSPRRTSRSGRRGARVSPIRRPACRSRRPAPRPRTHRRSR